jgi:hypothetical protein
MSTLTQNNLTGMTPLDLTGTSSSSATATGTLSPVLRYSARISTIPDCPANASAPFNGPVYRGIAGPTATAADFLPHAILHPGMFANAASEKQCSSWAVSMFESPAQMRKRFSSVSKTNRNYGKLVGMYCACLQVTNADGRRTHANANGHLEFHPYDAFDGVAAVLSVQVL